MRLIPNLSGVEISTPDGFQPFAALAVTGKEHGVRLEFEDGTSCTVSDTHLFLSGHEEVLATRVQAGDTLDTVHGPLRVVSASGIESAFAGPLHVHGHVYTTPSGLLHHNCQFVGSSTTLVGPDALDKLSYSEPVEYKYGYSFAIFERPVTGGFYMLGVDSSAGTGKDYSVIQVLRVHCRGKYEQVATYADNQVPPGKFARILKDISDYYNSAQAIVENNEIGKTVADEAWYTVGYDGIINTDKKGIGTRATRTSKLEACIDLKKFLEEGSLVLHDRQTIHELSIFEEVAPNIFKAPRNKHDDRVSALYWACYGLLQPEVDLDNLSTAKPKYEDVPQTYWGDSTDDVDIGWF